MSSRFVCPPWNNLILQEDAHLDSTHNVLHLTRSARDGNPRGSSVGRALYRDPVDLYDSNRRLVGFETSFTFRISSPPDNRIPGPGDGLAFFITDTDPPADSLGKFLGIYKPVRVVAVEFDTHPIPEIGDPGHQHVGININSVTPSAFTQWNLQDGEKAAAKVTYKSDPGILSVEVSYPNGPRVNLQCNIQLNTIFPERVRVGLSAATGQYAVTNEVLSWSFETN